MTAAPPAAIGRIVHYRISEHDSVPPGNSHAGDVVPAVIVRVWNPGYVNLMVLPDGSAPFWATSRELDPNPDGPAPSTWCWPTITTPKEPA